MRFVGFGLSLFIASVCAASAASHADWEDCKQDKDHDRRIAGCTRVALDQSESAGNRAIAHRNRGLSYQAIKALDRALADFEAALKLDPSFAAAYVNRGLARWANREQAIADFSEAIRLDPRLIEAYEHRGVVYHNGSEYDRAIADFSEAIKLDPRRANPHLARGSSYFFGKKDYDRAIADYSESIRLESNATKYSLRGKAYYAKKDFAQAIADYNEAIKIDPNSSSRYADRAAVYAERKDYDRAIADYGDAIKLDPKSALKYNDRGNIYMHKKDYDPAIADFSEAIKLNPKDAVLYNNRGVAFHFKKNYERAIDDYDQAIKLDPNNAQFQKNRDSAREARAALPPEKREPRHWLANNTRFAIDIIDNGKTVCSLAPSQDCWWLAGSGQHTIEIRRRDGKTMQKSISISGYGGVLHQLICPAPSNRTALPRSACD
jgi:tetratricopeptide (TPR) repeat protein